MKKPKYLWHGSTVKSRVLKPKQAIDLSGRKESNKKAIYATDLKVLAIEFGLIEKRAIKFADYRKKPVKMVIIKGRIRKGKKFYLYKLNTKGFREAPKGSHQWMSLKEVNPIEILELRVNDYLHLCRRATKKDKQYYQSLTGRFSCRYR